MHGQQNIKAPTCFGANTILRERTTTVTLASSNSALTDDGVCTETCWSFLMSILM